MALFTNFQRLKALEDENHKLKQIIAHLSAELEFLKMHPALLSGLKGETLVCDLVEGKLTSFARSYDIKVGTYKIEVKFSNLGIPGKGYAIRRLSWSKPLGYKDKGKVYDFLVLIGQKDNRFPDQYLDATPYVWFFIPRKDVEKLMFKGAHIGGIIQITTNFKTVKNEQSKMLLKYMVKYEELPAFIKPGE